MGSLMSGWDSPVLRSKSGAYKRNKSLTKEEIEDYWKSKQKIIDEHLKDITSLSQIKDQKLRKVEEELNSGAKYQRSNSMPNEKLRVKEGLVGFDITHDDDDDAMDKLIKKNGWWTRSNWAFLNEPPVIEGAPNRYVAQFHVANLANATSHPGDGIATT